MVQQELITIFDDCANRLAEGATIDECLRLYPSYAATLRPLLETQMQVGNVTIPPQEIYEDQALVWERIGQALPTPLTVSGVRSTRRLLLLIAASIVVMLVGGGWFALSRLLDTTATPVFGSTVNTTATSTESSTWTPTALPTATASPSTLPVVPPTLTAPTASATNTASAAPTLTATQTPSFTVTPAPTMTVPTATLTMTPSMTFAPGCGAPLTSEQAVNVVLRIFPNAVVTTVEQITRGDGKLVWVIDTKQGIKVTVDVACGIVLTIDRPGSGDTNPNDNNNDNIGNGNTNSNDNGGGSDDNGGDDSGMGGDSGMG